MPDTWCIYHITNCSHARPTPKDKFAAIVCRDAECMGFLINSSINKFILNRPPLLVCQVKIKASDYGFLDHDSYIDCIDLYPFEDTELIDRLCSIDVATKAEIKKAVVNSKTIAPYYQRLICSIT